MNPDAQDIVNRARQALRENNYEEAATELNALLAQDPRNVEALNGIAVINLRQSKFQGALSLLMEAVDADPMREEIHYNIASVHKGLGNLKAASMAYARALEINPDYAPAYKRLATIYEQLGEHNKAAKVFRQCIARTPEDPALHFNYGVALQALERSDEAAAEFQAAAEQARALVEQEPGNAAAWTILEAVEHPEAAQQVIEDTETGVLFNEENEETEPAPDDAFPAGEEIPLVEDNFSLETPPEAATEAAVLPEADLAVEAEIPPETSDVEMDFLELESLEFDSFETLASESLETAAEMEEATPETETPPEMEEAATAAAPDSELSLNEAISLDEEISIFDENVSLDTEDTDAEDTAGESVADFTFEPEAETLPEPVDAEVPDITLPEAEPLDFAAFAPEPEEAVEPAPIAEVEIPETETPPETEEAAIAAVPDSELSFDEEISLDEEIPVFDENVSLDTADTGMEDTTGEGAADFTFEPEAEALPEPVDAEVLDIMLPEAEPLDFTAFEPETETPPETEEAAIAAVPDSELSFDEAISFDEEISIFDENVSLDTADTGMEDTAGDSVADFTFEPEAETLPEPVDAEEPDIMLPEAEALDFAAFEPEAETPPETEEAAMTAVPDSELSFDEAISFDEEIPVFDETVSLDATDTGTEDTAGESAFEAFAPETENAEQAMPAPAPVHSPAVSGRKTPGTGKPSEKEIIEMMLYLKNLTAVLPENKREKFMNSDERLSL